MNGQASAKQAAEVLPDMWTDGQRGADLQGMPTLAEYEQVIERGQRTFVEVGEALAAIRDGRLYRETHGSFESYCRDRWGMGRNYANKLIAASELGTTVPNERQARALRAVSGEEPPIDEASKTEWDELVRVMDEIDALTSSDASYLAAAVPTYRRASTAKKLRKLGTYLGRIAWSLESTGEPE